MYSPLPPRSILHIKPLRNLPLNPKRHQRHRQRTIASSGECPYNDPMHAPCLCISAAYQQPTPTAQMSVFARICVTYGQHRKQRSDRPKACSVMQNPYVVIHKSLHSFRALFECQKHAPGQKTYSLSAAWTEKDSLTDYGRPIEPTQPAQL